MTKKQLKAWLIEQIRAAILDIECERRLQRDGTR